MYCNTVATTALLAAAAQAWPTNITPYAPYMKGFTNPTIQSSLGGNAICIAGTIPVTASAQNYDLKLEQPQDQTQLTEWILEYSAVNSTFVEQHLGAPKNVSGTYNIHSQLCFPSIVHPGDITDIQFLVHGGGFDSKYWDNAVGYSYVDYVASKGYASFSFDRLGTGQSEHPDPMQETQIHLQAGIAHELIQSLRSDAISGTAYRRIIGVGHSYGSAQLNVVGYLHPKDMDAVILTGASIDPSPMVINVVGQAQTIASQNEPARFSDLSNCYVLPGALPGLQWAFLHAPNFDPELLNIAGLIRQPQGLGEIFAEGPAIQPCPGFTGPVFIINGANDLAACHGDCLVPDNTAAKALELFPAIEQDGVASCT